MLISTLYSNFKGTLVFHLADRRIFDGWIAYLSECLLSSGQEALLSYNYSQVVSLGWIGVNKRYIAIKSMLTCPRLIDGQRTPCH